MNEEQKVIWSGEYFGTKYRIVKLPGDQKCPDVFVVETPTENPGEWCEEFDLGVAVSVSAFALDQVRPKTALSIP